MSALGGTTRTIPDKEGDENNKYMIEEMVEKKKEEEFVSTEVPGWKQEERHQWESDGNF